MKKYILSLVALTVTMSIQAQVVKVYKNGTLQETYTNTATDKYKVVFEEAADANLLTGKFSVSDTKKVQFTKGNLQATYSTSTSSYTWGFAANQWDYVGNAAGNTSITSDGKNTDGAVVDLFGWSTSTSTSNYGISTSLEWSTYNGVFVEWGGLFLGKNYFTLDKAKWTYLLNTSNATYDARTQTNRYAKAMVNNVKGLLIFPDNYNGTTAVTGIDGIATVNSTSAPFPTTSIPTETWTTMESAGVVFLPAAGRRFQSNVNDAGSIGDYWSSTSYGSGESYYLHLNKDDVSPASHNGRCYGNSVRLVSFASE